MNSFSYCLLFSC
uniref:Uncharacterized protein n=1 Tax=Rhizophora mucronata TaxID=61149 RepID=A0A2P2IS23_RHIMU